MSIQLLWNHVPILSKNLVDRSIVSLSLNDEVTKVALDTFTAYSKLHSSARGSKNEGGGAKSLGRKRNRRHGRKIQSNSTFVNSSGSGLTVNDFFFEHQRINGYTNGTPILSGSSGIHNLRDSLLIEVETYLGLLGGGASAIIPLIQSGIISLDVWAAIQMGRGAYHKDHVHENVLVSGVYYAKAPSGCAPIVFQKPIHFSDGRFGYENKLEFDTKLQSNEAKDSVLIKPQEGQVIIFPPWLLHGVPQVQENIDGRKSTELPRVSFAFNLKGAYSGDPWSVTQEALGKNNR